MLCPPLLFSLARAWCEIDETNPPIGVAKHPAWWVRQQAQELLVMLPVQKHSKSRKRKRRSHHALKPIHYVRCPQCGNAKLPHAACDNCGYVNPKLALQVEPSEG